MGEERPEPQVDAFAGFLAAICAPALLAGAFGLAGGPLALIVLWFAFVIATLHVILLAVPLYALLRRWREPAPATILLASFLIGGLPAPILFGWPALPEMWILGAFGLAGGFAFLHFSRHVADRREY
jgi:hypothetical protein